MKLKELKSQLQQLDTFEQPKITLEQYATSSEIVAEIINFAHLTHNDIVDKTIADLGCGCGALLIGASLFGARFVVGLDIDPEALEICRSNLVQLNIENADLLLCDVTKSPFGSREHLFDTVLLNPPFGTKCNSGIDLLFLKQAVQLSRHSVYSLHKSATRQKIMNIAARLDCKAEVVAELKFDLPATYKFHKAQSKDIEVDLVRLELCK